MLSRIFVLFVLLFVDFGLLAQFWRPNGLAVFLVGLGPCLLLLLSQILLSRKCFWLGALGQLAACVSQQYVVFARSHAFDIAAFLLTTALSAVPLFVLSLNIPAPEESREEDLSGINRY